ncbi:MAG: DUF805 domain-containing protein [Phenylobacterium sp.]|nr:MAG: DUF805 domain-containing protein [Phenylobacterium sp.]
MALSSGEFWKSLLTSRGRSNRGRFWTVIALGWGAQITGGAVASASGYTPFAPLLAAVIILAMMPISLFNAIKRLHDMGRSGWWLLASFIVFLPLAAMAELWSPPGMMALGIVLELVVAFGFLLILGCVPGQASANRFGAPPGQPIDVEEFA